MKPTDEHSLNADVISGEWMSPPEEDPRLVQALRDYREAMRGQWKPERQEFLARYPEIAQALAECLDGLEWIQLAGSELREAVAGEPSASRPELDMPAGTTLGDFRILREIGRGGMGVVYLALQASLHRVVALKVLPFAVALDAPQVQRFRHEAHAAAILHHAHIVPVFSVGSERGVHYFAMQYIEGQTLADLIRRLRPAEGSPAARASGSEGARGTVAKHGSLTARAPAPALAFGSGASLFRMAARWGEQAAEALAHAHHQGVVHRDIKPANLLVDRHGHLWVSDFGLARLRADAGSTRTGGVVGTLRYMSPEQALGKHGLVDHRTDIYALGVTLYELVTLTPAFAGGEQEGLLRQLAWEEPPRPRQINPAIPKELEIIVLKAMAKEPQDRYATAQDLADDLRRFLEDRPIRARPLTFWERGCRWARRHRVVVGVAAGTAALAGVVLVVTTLLVTAAYRSETEHRRQAVANQELAQKNLQLALKVLDQIYLQAVEQRYPRDPRRRQEDGELLRQALHFYEEFARENHVDPEVRNQCGRAYFRAGQIYQLLGEQRRAAQAYRESIRVLTRLAEEAPDNVAYEEALLQSILDLGRLLLAGKQAHEAAGEFRRALSRAQRAVDRQPETHPYRAHLAVCHGCLGQFYKETRQAAEAEAEYLRSIALLQRLTEDVPAEPFYLEALASFYHDLGALLADAGGRLDQAEDFFRQAVAVWERREQAFPAGNDHGKKALILRGLVILLRRRDKWAEARPAVEEAIRRQREALQARPWDEECRRYLRDDLIHLRDILMHLGDHAALARAGEDLLRVESGRWEDCFEAAVFLAHAVRLADGDRQLAEPGRSQTIQAYTSRARRLLRETLERSHYHPQACFQVARFLTVSPAYQLRNFQLAYTLIRKLEPLSPGDLGDPAEGMTLNSFSGAEPESSQADRDRIGDQ